MGFVKLCLPSGRPTPPRGPDWVHEIKHDGYRLIVRRDGKRVRVFHPPWLQLDRSVSVDRGRAALAAGTVRNYRRGSRVVWG